MLRQLSLCSRTARVAGCTKYPTPDLSLTFLCISGIVVTMLMHEGDGISPEPQDIAIEELQPASPEQFHDLTTQAVNILALAVEAVAMNPYANHVDKNGIRIVQGQTEEGADYAILERGKLGHTLSGQLIVSRTAGEGFYAQFATLEPHPVHRGEGLLTEQVFALKPGIASMARFTRGPLNPDNTFAERIPTERQMPPLLASQVPNVAANLKLWEDALRQNPRQSWLGRICRSIVRREPNIPND